MKWLLQRLTSSRRRKLTTVAAVTVLALAGAVGVVWAFASTDYPFNIIGWQKGSNQAYNYGYYQVNPAPQYGCIWTGAGQPTTAPGNGSVMNCWDYNAVDNGYNMARNYQCVLRSDVTTVSGADPSRWPCKEVVAPGATAGTQQRADNLSVSLNQAEVNGQIPGDPWQVSGNLHHEGGPCDAVPEVVKIITGFCESIGTAYATGERPQASPESTSSADNYNCQGCAVLYQKRKSYAQTLQVYWGDGSWQNVTIPAGTNCANSTGPEADQTNCGVYRTRVCHTYPGVAYTGFLNYTPNDTRYGVRILNLNNGLENDIVIRHLTKP